MTELRCPRCGDHYGPPARFCIRDGYALVPARASEPDPAESGREPGRRIWEPGASFVEPASRLTGRVLDGRYELGEQIGSGGMAFVYRATDRGRGRAVAVKVLSSGLAADPESVARLQREAELGMRLDHPNVCHMLAVGTDRGLHYLVMPLLAGENLSTRQDREGLLDVASVVTILTQLAAGLQHAHERGVLHRDLKPENVMMVADDVGERAVIMDFGLGKPATSDGAGKLTASGVVLGTPEFMSPEQVRGLPMDGRSDQYALALLAFELLTGDLPFAGGGTSQETMLQRLTLQPVPLRQKRPEAPEVLEAVLARALSGNRDDRYPDLYAFAAALEGAAS